MFKGSFFLNVNFDNPSEHCIVGLFIYEPKTDSLKLLEASGGINDTSEYQGVQTPSVYVITNKTFIRKEKSYQNGNIINQMVQNKENTYLCISKDNIDNLKIKDCYKIEFIEY